MSESKSCIVAQPGAVDLLIGPLFFAGVIGGAGAFGIARAFWKAEEIIDHWEVLLFFGLLFVPVFIGIRKLNASRSFWKLENGAVYRGGKLLFYLSEIEEAQVGLPDNWINQLDRLPVKFRGSGGIAYHAFARKQVAILKLKEKRWFLFSGLAYQNGAEFRDALVAAAPVRSIGHFSDAILPKIGMINVNRVLRE